MKRIIVRYQPTFVRHIEKDISYKIQLHVLNLKKNMVLNKLRRCDSYLQNLLGDAITFKK